MWEGGQFYYCILFHFYTISLETINLIVASLHIFTDVNGLLKFLRPLHEGTLVFVTSYDDPATK